MHRRIVVMEQRDELKKAWTSRSFAVAGRLLQKGVAVKGMSFVEALPPAQFPGRGTLLPSPVRARGFHYGAARKRANLYAMAAEFESEDALARFRKERGSKIVGVFADPKITHFASTYCGNAAVGRASDVARLLNTSALKRRGLTGTGVRVAIVDTGIDGTRVPVVGGWAPFPGYVPGSAPPDHGTMCAFDARIGAPKAKIYDFALLQSQGGTWSAFLSDAIAGFAELMQLLSRSPGPLVVNNSWGMFNRGDDEPIGSPENYSANPDHPFNQIVGSLVAAGADVLFAAGNCGKQCPDGRCGASDVGPGASIHGANSHPDVITVAAITVDDRRLGYSSQGPGGLYQRKPDIAGYSHFKGSGVYPADGGTSAACPVVAGAVAALRTKGSGRRLAPTSMKGLLQRSSRDVEGNGWDFDLGYGVVNVKEALRLL